MNRFVTMLTAIAAFVLAVSPLAAQTDTTFTYQGTLAESGAPADGSFDLEFSLFDALSGGSQVESTIVMNGVIVADGLLTAELDFGADAFDNSARWLEIVVEGTTLSPRQPITRAPYAIQTRGIFVDEDNNVGIGTSTPSYPLHVESDGLRAIYGHATATNSSNFGGWFQSDSIFGRGVHGTASASTGITNGVSGESMSTSGRGVFGFANASSGNTYGVKGQSVSTSGRGVHGTASASSGTTYGGQFESFSTTGRGVYGRALAGTGVTYGGYFESNSTAGRGVYGETTASSGITFGVVGISDSTGGRGVYGYATAGTGTTIGVRGYSGSTSGQGVFGIADASTGDTYGGRFENYSSSGRGVYGKSHATTGVAYGGVFESRSTTGRGVYGEANASSGVNYGGNFRSFSTTGRGLYGEAVANSGVNVGVYGRSNSSSGFDFYAGGAGANYGASSSRRWKHNVEPIGDPLRKLARLRGVYFDWDKEHGGQHDVGMIAEEVGKVLPEIVNYEENSVDAIGMDYSKMTPLLVEAVNALRSQRDSDIASLRAENEDLRQQLFDLQQMVGLLASKQEMENAQ